jgi:hypothetical protein
MTIVNISEGEEWRKCKKNPCFYTSTHKQRKKETKREWYVGPSILSDEEKARERESEPNGREINTQVEQWRAEREREMR